MDENDGIRTRLTHSHEVANLARSIGTRIFKRDNGLFHADLCDTVQPILLSIGLAHDLGNPPFGHQGEVAIGRWFDARRWIFQKHSESDTANLGAPIPDFLHDEFIKFDGNPQSLRLLTKLQTHVDHVGLDLTAATLAASLKYPVGVANRSSKSIGKKFGYFESERPIIEWVRSATGLVEGKRHPLTWIMEACDDIAYSVLDVEDAMKKGVLSPDDVRAILERRADLKDHLVLPQIDQKFRLATESSARVPIIRDIKISYLRAIFFTTLVDEASEAFLKASAQICAFDHETPLLEGSKLCDALKTVAGQFAFSNSEVLRTEAFGAAAIDHLMTSIWEAISARSEDDLLSKRTTAVARFVFSLISPNYLEAAVRTTDSKAGADTMRYRELRLMTDMVSGMTDTFAIKLWRELKQLP